MAKVGIVMGSDSDMPVMAKAAEILEKLGIDYEMTIISAHREPDVFFEYAKSAESKGFKVIIAGAGKAAHLPGMCAAIFPMPVIGIPMKTSDLGGVDSLYSIVQMPSGIPVATVAINGGANAGILAAKILAVSDSSLLERVKAYAKELKEQVQKKADEYYLKFSRVMDNLTATFAENRNALNNGTNAVNSNSYAVPMMNIQQICSLLDREVRQMDMPGLLRQFVTCMFTPDWDGNPVWIREEESRIAEAVRQFFAERAFPEIANSSMSQLAAAVTGQPAAAAVKMMLERGGMDFLKDSPKCGL